MRFVILNVMPTLSATVEQELEDMNASVTRDIMVLEVKQVNVTVSSNFLLFHLIFYKIRIILSFQGEVNLLL